MTVLEIAGLVHGYAGKRVLDDFSLTLDAGRHHLLLGPSGSGKTTLIGLIAGLTTPDAGRIAICGEAMTGQRAAGRDDLRRRRIGIIFQTLRLVGAISVIDNLVLAQRLSGGRADRAAARELLDRLGIAHRADARPHMLSQGEAQRAAIARALVGRPALLIADEPTSALDDANADLVAALLTESAATSGTTLLIATHDSRLKAHIPDVVTLAPGRAAEAA